MKAIKKSIFFTIVAALIATTSLEARQAYESQIVVSGQTGSIGAPNLVNFKQRLKTAAIQKVLPIYTPTSAVTFGIDLRGLGALASFAANSTTLNFAVPTLGISTTFTGATRDESMALLKEFLSENANGKKFLHEMAKVSPIDPIVGNPNSLRASMAKYNYLLGLDFAPCDCCTPCSVLMLGAEYSRSFVKEFNCTTVTLPIFYTHKLRYGDLLISGPFTLFETDGSYSAYGSLGLGYRMPLFDCWSLVPALRLGSGGSLDLTSAAALGLVSLTSNLELYHSNNLQLSMVNMAGWSSTIAITTSGIQFNYRVQEWIFRNGLNVVMCNPFQVCGHNTSLSAFFCDVAFSGDPLFMKHYDEVGAQFALSNINPRACWDELTVGGSYEFGQKGYKGFRLNLNYYF